MRDVCRKAAGTAAAAASEVIELSATRDPHSQLEGFPCDVHIFYYVCIIEPGRRVRCPRVNTRVGEFTCWYSRGLPFIARGFCRAPLEDLTDGRDGMRMTSGVCCKKTRL